MNEVAKAQNATKLTRDDLPMWVIGCIDSYGSITARADDGRQPMHLAAESRGKRWRWNVWQQEYGSTQNFDELSTEERFSVSDWLERHGYKEPISKETVEMDADELRVISDLAYLTFRSKQNVGTRLRDLAESVNKIVERKRLSKEWTQATEVKEPKYEVT